MLAEHRGCPFFTFELRIPPRGTEGVSLRLLGNKEARAVIRSEIEARGVAVLGPDQAQTPGAAAGLVAGAGALLCVLACSAPMLAVGGVAGSTLLVAAGHAEKLGLLLAVGGLLFGGGLVLRRALRRAAPREASCGAACGCSSPKA